MLQTILKLAHSNLENRWFLLNKFRIRWWSGKACDQTLNVKKGEGSRVPTENIFYCKRAILSSRLPNIDPPSPSLPGESVLPPQQRRSVHTRRAERGMGGGGSIFWKTREIGLPSYSKICTLWGYRERSPYTVKNVYTKLWKIPVPCR